MSTAQLEQKLHELTKRVESLEAKKSDAGKAPKNYLNAAGALADCDLFDEAMRLGAEWRARENSRES